MSAPVTLLRTFGGIPDNRIILNNGQFARAFDIPVWTKLRIGVRMNMSNTGANIPIAGNSAQFYIGLCSGVGVNDLVMDATPKLWCGIVTGITTNDWIYAVHTGTKEYFGFDVSAIKIVNGVLTNFGDIRASTFAIACDPTVAKRIAWFLDITRVGYPHGNYTFKCPAVYTQDGGSGAEISVAAFKALGSAAVPAAADYAASNTGTLNIDESVNILNAINIAWNVENASTAIEICDIGIWKVS